MRATFVIKDDYRTEKKMIRLATVFSGIGAIETALKYLNKEYTQIKNIKNIASKDLNQKGCKLSQKKTILQPFSIYKYARV